jgi:hypothetical protein
MFSRETFFGDGHAPVSVGERDVRRRGAVALLVGDDLAEGSGAGAA